MSTIGILSARDQVGFAELMSIYKASIEPTEQKSPSEIAAQLERDDYVFLVGRDGEKIAGFAILFFPSNPSFWLLEYMAVDQRLRSSGLGAQLFRAALNAGEKALPGAPCILEVDATGAAARPGNDPVRRLAFYRRLGCRAISQLDYILPLAIAGTPPPMQLLVCGLKSSATLPRTQVQAILSSLYTEVYSCSPKDSRLKQMVQPLQDHVALVAM